MTNLSNSRERVERRLIALEQMFHSESKLFSDRDGTWTIPMLRGDLRELLRISPASEDEPNELVSFFRTDGFRPYGHTGDYEGWSPEQTAIHFLREHLKCKPAEWPISPAMKDDDAEWLRYFAGKLAQAGQQADARKRLEAIASRLEQAREPSEAMRDALTAAAKQFRHYEQLHLAKGTSEGDAKAHNNACFAEQCEAALAMQSSSHLSSEAT